MSHITNFRIAGLVGRPEVIEHELNRDINIFFGPNGCGKTSLLRILDSAMANDSSLVSNVPFDWAEVTIYSLNFERTFKRRLERSGESQAARAKLKAQREQRDVFYESDGRVQFVDGGVVPEQWVTTPKKPARAQQSLWRHEFLPTWRMQGDPRRYTARHATQQYGDTIDWDKIFAGHLEHLWTTYSNEMLGRVRSIQDNGFESILRGVLSAGTQKQKATNIDPALAYSKVQSFFSHRGSGKVPESKAKFIKHFKSDPKFQRVVGDINSVEERIEEAMESRGRLESLIKNLFGQGKKLIYKDRRLQLELESGETINLECLSSGEKQVLRIFIEAILIDESALLIDEPEISLHVDWQRQLISAMNMLNPNAQLIFASHSPEVMAEVADDKIFSL